MMQKHAPFMMGIYMAHCCNLVVQTLSNLLFVAKIEALIASMYMSFVHCPKTHLEHIKLAKIMETEGLNFFHNVKTHGWFLCLHLPSMSCLNTSHLCMKIL
jgi:hypothetical protein